MRHLVGFLSAAVLVSLSLSGCATLSSETKTPRPTPSKHVAAASDSCDKFYEAKAYDACKTGDIAQAKQLEAAYESGTGSYSPPPEKKFGVGDTLSSGGATLTLVSYAQVPTVAMNESNFRQGSGYETYTDRAPDPGSAFYELTATVKNDSKTSMDLTCSLGVAIQLLSADNEKYDPIDDLYKIKGNPECNHMMQPGYSENMTWIFQAPADRHIVGAFFTEPFDTASPPGIFTLDPNYTLSQGGTR
ncbi:hypothetical protein [Leifsonia xyli]|uniref:hypothetical protein n=1 Tax=Leifsonia xyli TaxID=1575 RepID=UPI003D67B26F